MIEFHHVSKRYETSYQALANVSFDIAEREFVFLTGHSGAGKSTLMKLIALIERPTAGQIVINGRNLNRVGGGKVPMHRRQVGIVFQNHHLLFDRSVYQNVALPLQIAGHHAKEVARRVRASLDKVGLLDKENAMPITLSGGEQQRVGIARAVVNKPALILADEPTGNLDPALSENIMRLFQQFNDVGVTILIASHDIALIRHLGHRVLGLEGGQLVHDGQLELADG